MSTPKGYFSQTKEERSGAEHVTVSKADNKVALDVRDTGPVTDTGSDAVEAGTTVSQIVATGHAVKAGDRIRMTSGAASGEERDVLSIIDANNFDLVAEFSSAPAPGDTFNILRPVSLTLSSTGGFSSVTSFTLNGSNTEVTEDTGTPSLNRPLPVKLFGVDPISITADQLDINLDHVDDSVEIRQTTHDNVNLNANMQVGDTDVANGNPVPVSDAGGSITIDNANLDAAISTRATESTLSTLNAKFVTGTDIGDVTINNAAGASAVNIQDGGNSITVDGVVTVQDGGGSITIDNANLDVALSTRATEATLSTLNAKFVTGTDIGDVTINNAAGAAAVNIQDGGNSITVDDGAGSLTIDNANLDVALSTRATETTLSTINGKLVDGTDIGDVTINNAAGASAVNIQDGGNIISVDDGGASLTVDVGTALPTGTNTIGAVNINRLDVVDFLDTPLLDAGSTAIPASGSYLTVVGVGGLAAAVQKIQVFDTTGEFWGIYSDPGGTPVLEAVVGPGSNETIEVVLPATTIIGLSSLTASPITSGNVTMNFLG